MEHVVAKRRGFVAIVLCGLLASAATTALGAIDLSGDYRADVTGFVALPDFCTVSVTQTGTSLSLIQSCNGGSTGTASGTIDTSTGVFSITGQCDFGGSLDPYTLSGTGAADSLSFSATGFCGMVESGLLATKCGNGIADALEACEDGNRASGDCCSATCALETAGQVCDGPTTACTFSACDGAGSCVAGAPSAAGTACDVDADLCTADACDGAGSCQALGQPVTCDICSSCDTTLGCVGNVKPDDDEPGPGECLRNHLPSESKLKAKSAPVDPRDRLKWLWRKGPSIDPADFGDPINTTAYRLCAFQRAGSGGPYRTFAAVDLAPGTDWRVSPGGFKLIRKTPLGAAKLILRSSSVVNKQRIVLNGKGAFAGLVPVFEPGARDLVVQLSADTGKCWSSRLSALATETLIKTN